MEKYFELTISLIQLTLKYVARFARIIKMRHFVRFSNTVLAKDEVEEIEKGIFLQNVSIDRCRIEKSATYQSGLFLQILWRSHHNTVYLSTKNSTMICNMKREWKNKPLLSFFHESQSCFLNCFYMSSILINLQMEVSKWNKFPRFTADCFLFYSITVYKNHLKCLILNF